MGYQLPALEPRAEGARSGDAVAASDQLRRTLTLISGYSQTLLHLQLDEAERSHYLNGIVRAVESLSEQAEEILGLVADHRAVPAGRPVVTPERPAVPPGNGSEPAT